MLHVQVEAFKKNLHCYFSCYLDTNLSENLSVSPLGYLERKGGILTLHIASLQRTVTRWWQLFPSETLKHFVLGLSKE